VAVERRGMSGAWFFVVVAVMIAMFPKLVGRTKSNDPVFSEADEPGTLRAIRAGAAAILSIFLFTHLKA
jgi:hypothetical protein